MPSTITLPGTAPAIFEICCANLGPIGMPRGAIVQICPIPPSPGSAVLATNAGKSILGILISRLPDLLYQPGQVVELDETWTLSAVEIVPIGNALPV